MEKERKERMALMAEQGFGFDQTTTNLDGGNRF